MIKWLLLDELSHSKQGWTQELLSLHRAENTGYRRDHTVVKEARR